MPGAEHPPPGLNTAKCCQITPLGAGSALPLSAACTSSTPVSEGQNPSLAPHHWVLWPQAPPAAKQGQMEPFPSLVSEHRLGGSGVSVGADGFENTAVLSAGF